MYLPPSSCYTFTDNKSDHRRAISLLVIAFVVVVCVYQDGGWVLVICFYGYQWTNCIRIQSSSVYKKSRSAERALLSAAEFHTVILTGRIFIKKSQTWDYSLSRTWVFIWKERFNALISFILLVCSYPVLSPSKARRLNVWLQKKSLSKNTTLQNLESLFKTAIILQIFKIIFIYI